MQFGLLAVLFLSPNPPFLFPNYFGRKSTIDFAKIYVAAKLASSDHPEQVYDPEAMVRVSMEVLHTTEKPDSSESSTYTPHMSALVAPLAKLPIITAYWLWLGANITSAVAAMYLILRKERKFDRWSTAVISMAVLGSINSMTVLLAGQTTWHMFLFFCICYWGLVHKNDMAIGLSFAMATIKPQYSFLYFAGLIAEKRWRALLIFSVAVALMLAYAVHVLGWQSVVNYPQAISHNSTSDATWFPERMCNIRALFNYVMPDPMAYKVSFGILFLSMPFVYMLWRSVGVNPDRRRWIFAITMLLSMTLGPHVNCYDCMLVGVAAILTLPSASPIEMWKITSMPYRIYCFLMLLYPILGWTLGSNNWVFMPLNVAMTVCAFMHLRTLDKNLSTPCEELRDSNNATATVLQAATDEKN